jgi:hypothetical protein
MMRYMQHAPQSARDTHASNSLAYESDQQTPKNLQAHATIPSAGVFTTFKRVRVDIWTKRTQSCLDVCVLSCRHHDQDNIRALHRPRIVP